MFLVCSQHAWTEFFRSFITLLRKATEYEPNSERVVEGSVQKFLSRQIEARKTFLDELLFMFELLDSDKTGRIHAQYLTRFLLIIQKMRDNKFDAGK